MSTSAAPTTPAVAGDRRSLLSMAMLIMALVAFLGIHWQTIYSMMHTWWRSDTYAHGLVIVPIMLYMVWERRNRLYQAEIKSAAAAVLLIAVLTLAWLVGRSANVLVVQQFAVTAMLPVLVYMVFGADFCKRLIFPLLYLFFLVPFGESLVPYLQDITTVITVSGLQASGIPVLQEGRYLTIPTGKFEVAAACSGIRYLIASVAVGTCYAYLCYVSPWRRLAFIVLAMLVPIAANGLRAYGIVMVAHLSEMRLAVGVDHFVYGWVFFGLVMFVLFWVGSFWHDQPEDRDSDRPAGLALDWSDTPARTLIVVVAGMVVMLAGPVFWNKTERALVREGDQAFEMRFDAAGSDWLAEPERGAIWQAQFKGATEQEVKVYTNGESEVLLYYAYFARETQGKELINSLNTLYDGRTWRRINESPRTIALQGREMQLRETLLGNRAGKLLVWHWYDVEGRVTANRWHAKLLAVKERLFGRHHRGSAVFAVASPVLEDQDTRLVLQEFLKNHRPALQ